MIWGIDTKVRTASDHELDTDWRKSVTTDAKHVKNIQKIMNTLAKFQKLWDESLDHHLHVKTLQTTDRTGLTSHQLCPEKHCPEGTWIQEIRNQKKALNKFYRTCKVRKGSDDCICPKEETFCYNSVKTTETRMMWPSITPSQSCQCISVWTV